MYKKNLITTTTTIMIIMMMIIIIINPILVSVHAESMVLCITVNNRDNYNSYSNNIILLTMATSHAWTTAKIRTASMKVFSSCTMSSSLKFSSVSEAASSRSTNELFFWVPETAHFTLEDSAVSFAYSNNAVTNVKSSVSQLGESRVRFSARLLLSLVNFLQVLGCGLHVPGTVWYRTRQNRFIWGSPS